MFQASTTFFNKGVRERLETLVGINYDLQSRNKEPAEILKRASKGPVFW